MADIDVEEANIMIAQDEERIKRRYSHNTLSAILNFGIILAAAYLGDLKWTVAIGLASIAAMVGAQDARRFDLAVRIARTNSLLRDHMIIRGRKD
jgi:hypothetical protein